MNWQDFRDNVDTVTEMFGEHEPSDMPWDVLLTKIELLDDKIKRLGDHVDDGIDNITNKL